MGLSRQNCEIDVHFVHVHFAICDGVKTKETLIQTDFLTICTYKTGNHIACFESHSWLISHKTKKNIFSNRLV